MIQFGLHMAKLFSIDLRETMSIMSEENERGLREPFSTKQLLAIDYLAEWHLNTSLACITASQCNGLVFLEPNTVLRALWAAYNGGDVSGLDMMVSEVQRDPLAGEARLYELFPTAQGKKAVVQMLVSALKSLDYAATHPQHVQFAASRPIDVQIGRAVFSPGVAPMGRIFKAHGAETVTFAFPGLEKFSVHAMPTRRNFSLPSAAPETLGHLSCKSASANTNSTPRAYTEPHSAATAGLASVAMAELHSNDRATSGLLVAPPCMDVDQYLSTRELEELLEMCDGDKNLTVTA